MDRVKMQNSNIQILNVENGFIIINGMQKIFYLAIIVFIANSSIVSIGSCATYSNDGILCQNCIENFHLFNGVCYQDIPNCITYKTGISCQQCSNGTILVSNSCLDSQSLQKMLASQKGNSNQFSVVGNMDKISQVVNFIENGFIGGSNGHLVAFDVRVYSKLLRWFMLYQFDSQFISNQRVIVDMDLNSLTLTAIDYSSLKNPRDFSTMFWRDVDNQSSILNEYSDYYPTSTNYLKINVRKALVSQVNQFEIFSVSISELAIRDIYSTANGNILLNQQIQNLSSSNITTPTVFQPYQLVFNGSEIDSEINIDANLNLAVNLIKGNPSWNHTLVKVIESGNAANLTEFVLIGVNSVTTFTGVVVNNPLNGNISLVKMTVEIISQDDNNSTNNNQQLKNNHTFVEEDGCTIHTTFTPPFDADLKTMADELLRLKNQKTLSGIPIQPDSSTPFIQAPALVVRRIVVTSLCQTYNYREVAYVEGDTVSTKEYFTYYLEEYYNSTKTWYYLGNKTKVQTTAVYSNPTLYPINYVDPSFNNYPYATLYDQLTVKEDYVAGLSPTDAALFSTLTTNRTSEIDRMMVSFDRFQVDSYDKTIKRWRSYGWKVNVLPDLFPGFRPYKSCLCDEMMITETFIIGESLAKGSTVQSQQIPPTIKGNLVRNDNP